MSDLSPQEARALIDAATAATRRRLDVRLHEQLFAWGVAWVVGLSAMWWDVRDQQPYVGPGPLSLTVFAVLLGAALALTGARTAMATRGIGGESERRGRVYGLTWTLGFLCLYAVDAAVSRQGAPPEVMGLVLGGGAIGLTGLMYLMSTALWRNPATLVLGAWLLVLAAVAGFTGPVTLLLLGALGGGGAFAAAGV
ncbi:MAG: hypothetical protein ACR2LI_09980, partial [Propionibacteriaceae bacterium]